MRWGRVVRADSSARGMYEQGREADSIRTATWSDRSAGRALGPP